MKRDGEREGDHDRAKEEGVLHRGASGAALLGWVSGAVFSASPSGDVMSPAAKCPVVSGGGAGMGCPDTSFQTPAAKNTVPLSSRIVVHGENRAPGGGTTQRPAIHAHFEPLHDHSPSSHTGFPGGRAGMNSTRAGGAGTPTGSNAAVS